MRAFSRTLFRRIALSIQLFLFLPLIASAAPPEAAKYFEFHNGFWMNLHHTLFREAAVKANVAAGQADPESYALVYDRSQGDLGKKHLYGGNLVCNVREKLHEAPIEDEAHVNQRRAELGLI